MQNIAWFVLSAVCEIAGCYTAWMWRASQAFEELAISRIVRPNGLLGPDQRLDSGDGNLASVQLENIGTARTSNDVFGELLSQI